MSRHLRKVNAAPRRDQAADPSAAEDGKADASSTNSGSTSSGDVRGDS
jgi:hypothetical protein